jgi:hypothetical protein
MSNLSGNEIESRVAAAPAHKHRHIALVQLIATVALALCTLIAVTMVSIGFARADLM